MTKLSIATINRQTAKQIGEMAQDALSLAMSAVGADLAVKYAGGVINGDTEVTLKFTFTLQTAGAKAQRDEEANINLHLLGLPRNAVGLRFLSGHKTYEIVGCDIGKSRFNVIVRRPDGKTARMAAADIGRILGVNTVPLATQVDTLLQPSGGLTKVEAPSSIPGKLKH